MNKKEEKKKKKMSLEQFNSLQFDSAVIFDFAGLC